MKAAARAISLENGVTSRWSCYGVATIINRVLVAIWRGFSVVFFSSIALIEIAVTVSFVVKSKRLHVRADWLSRWCQFACRVLGIHVNTSGAMPDSGLLVCNHLSYLDIVVLSSIGPCVFVAKRDITTWPLFGWLTRAAGAIFADRERRLASGLVVDLIREAIAGGSLVVLFPEGTSSDGSTVLPFKPALFEAAVQLGCEIHVAAINYALENGSVADEICYWRDMTLVPHLLNLFTKRTIEARVAFARSDVAASNRKELARGLQQQIVELRS